MLLTPFTTAIPIFALFFLPSIFAQDDAPPSTFPHIYPGKPSGDLSPAYQSYYEVTEPLPNVTFDVGRMFAGNIPVGRQGHPNDTYFFWAFEKTNGSLTSAANASTDPWGIWLNGGPGSSSMYGVLLENGPIRVNYDYSISQNNYSWNKVADYIWIDQPVGIGFSTADANGYIDSEEQMAIDFFGFLTNLVKVFPSLATRPLHLTGESYAGVYIPYILKRYFEMTNPPVKIAAIAIGDGSIAAGQVFELLPALSVIETYPQIIGYDTEVYEYFKEQNHLCGYDVNLTYPQNGIIPSIPVTQPTQREIPYYLQQHSLLHTLTRRDGSPSSWMSSKRAFNQEVERRYLESGGGADTSIRKRDRHAKREAWKRDLTGRANGTIDPWYGCFLFDEFMDYAKNFTFPWSENDDPNDLGFGIYYVPDALSPQAPTDASVFLNDNRTRAALHAPTSKDWALTFPFPFGELTFDPSPEPMVFLTDLATNATAHNVSVILYSGNDDALIAHRGTEITIQNTTFGGIQGFTRKPSTPWFDDSGNPAGIIRQERGWTYVLFQGAGHIVPAKKPAAALTFLREFVFGNNQTGLVTASSDGTVSVQGGENSTLAADILPGQDEIYIGAGATQSTFSVVGELSCDATLMFHSDFSSPPSSPSLAAVDSSPPSSPGRSSPFDDDCDKPIIHPFAASARKSGQFEKRGRDVLFEDSSIEHASKKARMNIEHPPDDFGLDESFPAISFSEEDDEWDKAVAQVIDFGHGTISLENKNLTYIPEHALRDLQGFRALPEKAELLNAKKFLGTAQLPGERRQFHRVSTAPASTTNDLFPSFPERTSSAASINVGLPREEIQLFLSRNKIIFLPSLLFQIDRLTVLSLRANSVTYLPPEVCNLRNLRELNVANNQLRYLPSELLQMNLMQLTINPNPFMEVPEESLPTPMPRRTFSRAASLIGTRARLVDVEARKRIVSPSRSVLPDVIPLVELCLRVLFSSPDSRGSRYDPSKSTLGSKYHLPLAETQYLPTTKNTKIRLPPGKAIPPLLENSIAIVHPGSIYAEEFPQLDTEDDDSRVTGLGFCPSPKHAKEPPGPSLFVRHAEERFTWVDTINGVKLGGYVPLRWRGCQHGCLRFLDEDGEDESSSSSSVAPPIVPTVADENVFNDSTVQVDPDVEGPPVAAVNFLGASLEMAFDEE
ncbi:hypothetical protein ONZ45_g16841 [Pleurotus djamor]|nr:hypothetical protein ONZ45_g16841 [Pleurotus djamor]